MNTEPLFPPRELNAFHIWPEPGSDFGSDISTCAAALDLL
jgi:hypothetical protein